MLVCMVTCVHACALYDLGTTAFFLFVVGLFFAVRNLTNAFLFSVIFGLISRLIDQDAFAHAYPCLPFFLKGNATTKL